MSIKFGPSGNSQAFFDAGFAKSEDSATWVKNLGLDCFEYSFGRGVNMSDEKALEIGAAFKNAGVEISVHAPYYINLANPDEEMAVKSLGYIIDSAKKVMLLGGNRVVFHPASQGKETRETAVARTKERFLRLAEKIYNEGLEKVMFCPETMGKLAQIGTVEEITDFCKTDEAFTPCVDFGHVNAREQGSLKTEEDFGKLLSVMIDGLGYERVKNFHVHFSKIEYSARGEVRHLTFEDKIYGPEFAPLAVALKKYELTPYIVCESAGTQDFDALIMRKIYYNN
ncbi:MAG: TIM barrel protein [Clostridia bacterium]|nr:TIM barrel protein [Clostridia bacterium]